MRQHCSRAFGRVAISVFLIMVLLVSEVDPAAVAQTSTPLASPANLTRAAPLSLTGERRAQFEA